MDPSCRGVETGHRNALSGLTRSQGRFAHGRACRCASARISVGVRVGAGRSLKIRHHARACMVIGHTHEDFQAVGHDLACCPRQSLSAQLSLCGCHVRGGRRRTRVPELMSTRHALSHGQVWFTQAMQCAIRTESWSSSGNLLWPAVCTA